MIREHEVTNEDLAEVIREQAQELSHLTELLLALQRESMTQKQKTERILNGMIKCYELLTERPAAPPEPQLTGEEVFRERVVGELCVNKLEGKYYFSVKVPSWMKHGVRVWPEVLEAVGIEADGRQLDYEPVDLTGWMCEFVLNDNGNPKKAIALTPPQ